MNIKKITDFLHITDEDGLDLTDLAFICIVIKIMSSTNLDWPSIMVLATLCVNKMHKRQQDSSISDLAQVQQQAQQIKDIEAKIAPVIAKIQEITK